MGEHTGAADEQNTEVGGRLERERSEAVVATERVRGRHLEIGRPGSGAERSELDGPGGGANVAAGAARGSRFHTGRVCADLTTRPSRPRQCQVSDSVLVIRFQGCRSVEGWAISCSVVR